MTLVSIERNGAVAIVRLDNPPVNAINLALLADLESALLEAEGDTSVGAIVLTGSGKGFCAGGDTKSMGNTDPVAKHHVVVTSAAVTQHIARLPKPVVGAIHGFAVGAGLSMAISCDVTVAEIGTRFRMGFRDVALTPDMGAHYFLAEALGVRRAKEMIWSGGGFTAEEGVALGLLNKVVPDGEAVAAAVDEAAALAAGPRTAIAYTKAVLAGYQADQLRQVLEAEGWTSAMLRTTADHREAITAQQEKRPPVFGQG